MKSDELILLTTIDTPDGGFGKLKEKQRLHIVIIEDNPDDRDFIRHFLLQDTTTKFIIYEADTGAKGLAMCLSGELSLECIILDLNLPDMDGLAFIKALKQSAGKLNFPIIILTGADGQADKGRVALGLGAQDYLNKSWIKAESLSRAVLNAIERFGLTRRLKESEERLRYTLAGAKAGVWDWDVKSDKIIWSQETFELYGIEAVPTTLRLENWLQAIHPDDREGLDASIQRVFDEHELNWRSEFRITHPHHGVRWLLGLGRIEYDTDNKALRVGGINLDISDSKRGELALKDADRRKDEFLATLAHELRNPLASINNAIQIMMQCGSTGSGALTLAREMIARQVRHMVRLIDDLLDVSRITLGRIELRKESVSLTEILNHALETSQHNAESHHVDLILPKEQITLTADSVRLAQVFSNLLSNSYKYTEKGGLICLTAECENDQVVVKVKDNGIGIAAEYLPNVFAIFSQIDSSVHRSQGGLGIGLSLVKGLVELHGGSVEAYSAGPGKGTEFTVKLPCILKTVSPPIASPTACKALMSPTVRRILIVDDNIDSAESLGMLLQLAGNEVEIAHDGFEGVALAARFHPHVALLDIGMPKLDGYETCRRIREQPGGQNIQIIAQTGWGSEKDRQRTREAGFDMHFVKPIDSDEIINALNRLSGKKIQGNQT